MVLIFLIIGLASTVKDAQTQSQTFYQHQIPNKLQHTISYGRCRVVFNPQCPDTLVTFFLSTQANPNEPEPIYMASSLQGTNLEESSFDPAKPTKIVIHGFASNRFLTSIKEITKQYLQTYDYNIFVVDWSPLCELPCYLESLWNIRHVAKCITQLLNRIRDTGATDIHIIGHSLGAQIGNFIAVDLRPYKLPRITGLDPALPGFVKVGLDDKLDNSDAEFVDVFHTNAFIQGQVEEVGQVDFYFNGGSMQPACWGSNDFFICNHYRSVEYFAESINSEKGFWGWKCDSYLEYLIGKCPASEVQILAGNNVSKDETGTYMVTTSSFPPFALGKYNTTFSITRLSKPPKHEEDITNNIDDIVTNPETKLIEKYYEEFVHPSSLEEYEMLKNNFKNDMAIKNEVFGNDFGVFAD